MLFIFIGYLIIGCNKKEESFSTNKEWVEKGIIALNKAEQNKVSVSTIQNFISELTQQFADVKNSYPKANLKEVNLKSITFSSLEVIEPYYADKIRLYLIKGNNISTERIEVYTDAILVGQINGGLLNQTTINVPVENPSFIDFLSTTEDIHLIAITEFNQRVNELALTPQFEIRLAFDAYFENF